MSKLLRVTALLAALILVAATPAAAGNAMTASLGEGTYVRFDTDPVTIAARCFAEYPWVWILGSVGSGELTSEAYTGPVQWSSEHCTRLLSEAAQVGKAGAGLLTMVTPSGELYAVYEATFVFKGEFPEAFRTSADGLYTITGGTGLFANAAGHGHLGVVDNSGVTNLDLHGSLDLGG